MATTLAFVPIPSSYKQDNRACMLATSNWNKTFSMRRKSNMGCYSMPPSTKHFGSKIVFTIKHRSNRFIEHYKAWLVFLKDK